MRKIKVTDAAGGYVYDEKGKRYKCIGNVNYHSGDDAYCSGSACLGNTRRGFKPMLAKTAGDGFPLWYARASDFFKSRVISPWYYQKDFSDLFTGEYVSDMKKSTKNLQTQPPSDWDGQFFHYYLFPGLYNVENSVNLTYADVKAADKGTRLLTIFNDSPVLQKGMLKASTANDKITLKFCEPRLTPLDDDIYYSDKIIHLISYISTIDNYQDYLYLSLYKIHQDDTPAPDESTKYEGTNINNLSVSSKNVEISFTIEDKIQEEMQKCFSALAQKDAAPVYPSLETRPLPQPHVLWFTATDPDYQRIDDLAESGQYLQFSNVKLFNATDEACTLSLHAVGLAYGWVKHVSPAGKWVDYTTPDGYTEKKWVPDGTLVNEWVPLVVNGYFTFYADKTRLRLVHFAYDSKFLEHTVFEKYFPADTEVDTSDISISASENLTPRDYISYKNGRLRIIRLGAKYGNYNNIYTSKVDMIDDGFKLKLTDSLEFDSKRENICSIKTGKEIIKVGKTCNAGINDFNKFKILLVNEKAYLLKDDQLLKKADLSIKDRILLNVALSYSKDVSKTLKEGL